MHDTLTPAEFPIEALTLVQGLLEHSHDGVLAVNRELRYVLWNPAMERISGLAADRVLGRHARDVFPSLAETGEEQFFLSALAGESSFAREQRFVVPETGSQGYFEGRYSPLRNAEGEVVAALAILRDVTLERQVRERADALRASEDRLRVLARASALLASSLDYETTLARIPRLAVPHLADFCLVDLVEDGEVRRVALAHADPAREVNLRELSTRFPPDLYSLRPTRVLRTGESVLIPDVDLAAVGGNPYDPDHLRRLQELGVRSYIAVPLVVRGEILGALGLALTRSNARHTPADLSLAQELAQRAAVAVDHARLYRAARREIAERERAQSELAATAERLGLAMAAANLGDFEWDLATDLIHVSEPAARIFGIPPGSQMTRAQVRQVLHPEDRPRAERAAEESVRRSSEYEIQYRVRRPDGTYRWAATKGRSLKDADGKVTGMLGVIQDITDEKEAEAAYRLSEERYRSLVAATAQMVWITDPQGAVREEMPGWCDFTGRTVEETLGWGWLEDVHPDDRYASRCIWEQALATGELYVAEYRLRGKDGKYRHFHARGVPVFAEDGSVREWVGVCLDIHDRKELEAALQRRAEELAEADRRKTEYLSMLAHELRNPLGAASNALHVLTRTPPEAPAHQRALEVALRQISQQRRLVDDLLDVSRIERGKIDLQMESLDLAQVVRDTLEDHRSALEAAGVSLVLRGGESPVLIEGDAARLRQVLGNLLDNARKFTPSGGTVTVTLSALTSQEQVELKVSDTGSGIEPSVLPQLFQAFVQADATLDRSLGGLGLGLALVRGLTRLHGGEVWATSEGRGQGATFRVRLPTTSSAAARLHAAPEAGEVPGGLRILVIEDIPDAAESLRDLLELFGHDVDVAHSGCQGLEKVAVFQPHVVLCDIGLPGMSGYEVAETLRREAAAPLPLLVALTGYGGSEEQQRSHAAGFDVHLTKPVHPEHLQEVLTREPGAPQ